jgi:hypothetical protein
MIFAAVEFARSHALVLDFNCLSSHSLRCSSQILKINWRNSSTASHSRFVNIFKPWVVKEP